MRNSGYSRDQKGRGLSLLKGLFGFYGGLFLVIPVIPGLVQPPALSRLIPSFLTGITPWE